MKIDMHVHTTISSPCSLIEPEALLWAAREAGLDGVCVTEHDEIEGAEVLSRMGREQGFPVFRGIEIYTDMGDVLVYGLYRDTPRWEVPFEELLAVCRETGAVLVPAHPCRVTGELERLHGTERTDFMMRNVDAVETRNGGCTPEGNHAAEELASRYGLQGLGGSDAHHVFQVGRCFTLFEELIESDEELVAAIRSGGFRALNGPPGKVEPAPGSG